jgi:hypothetical protein
MARPDASYDDSRAEEALAMADYENEMTRMYPTLSLEQAISQVRLRKLNLDHIYEPQTSTGRGIVKIREDELDRVLEILSQVRP